MQKTVKYPKEDSKKKESNKEKSKKRKGKKNKSKSTKKNKNEKNTNDNEKKNINSFTKKYSQPNISKKLNAKDEQQNSIKNLEYK